MGYFTSITFLLVTYALKSVSSLSSGNDTCNSYYFQEFSSYPHNSTSFYDCDEEDSSSSCAKKCISKSENCASFIVDFKHKKCYTITSKEPTPKRDPLHHSYLHCTTKECTTCQGFLFQPNTVLLPKSRNAIITQQVESGWCAEATKSLPGAAFTVSQQSNLCDIIPNEWTLAPSDTQNAFYPCSTESTMSPESIPLSTSLNSKYGHITSNVSCANMTDGMYPDPQRQPPCQYFYACAAGQILLQGSCEYPLIFGTNLGACDIPGIATCSALASPPPPPLPPSLNFSTGLDTSSMAAELRAGNQTRMNEESRYISFDEEHLPRRVDWSPLFDFVREQRSNCSGCWAYSAVDAIQAAQMIGLGLDASSYKDGPLSVEQILSCSGNLSSCNGGWPEDALEYAASVGSIFPASRWNNSCAATIDEGALRTRPVLSWERVPPNDPVSLKKALANQPVIVGISTEGNLRQWNSAGVYHGHHMGGRCTLQTVNHNLLLVGYTKKYWLARNSWGRRWGNDGYIKIKMTREFDSGICNMLSISPVYPVVSPATVTKPKRNRNRVSKRKLVEDESSTEVAVAKPERETRRELAAETCNGYAFQPDAMFDHSPASFYSCPSTDSSTECASKCALNAPNCTDFVLDVTVNECHAVLNYIAAYNSSFHAYLQCLDSSCSGCHGYRFFPGVQLSPISGNETTQPLDPAGCAAFCESTNCTAFNVDQSSQSCRVIYDSVSSSYASVNSYYSCAPTNTTVSNVTSPGLSYYCPAMAALCGAGNCIPNSSYTGGYVCQCPAGMVASTDSSGLSICVTRNVCVGSTFDPCSIGTCIVAAEGAYTCQCPNGYFSEYNAAGSLTCVSKVQYALTDVGYYYSVPDNLDCNGVSSATGLGVNTLEAINRNVGCASYGGHLTVIGPSIAPDNNTCGMLYQLSSLSDTCTSVRSMFGLSATQFASLNPAICPSPSSCVCRSRSTVCVEDGRATALGYPCSSYDTILPGDSCSSIIARHGMSTFSFFLLNPGVDCDSLTAGDMVCNSPYSPNYVTAYLESRRKLLQLLDLSFQWATSASACPCQHGCFTVQNGNTCINLANTYYRCSIRLLQYWNGLVYQGFVCVDSQLIPGRTVLCYPPNPGGC